MQTVGDGVGHFYLDDKIIPCNHRTVQRPGRRRPTTSFVFNDLSKDHRPRNVRLSVIVYFSPDRFQRSVDHTASDTVENDGARYQIGALQLN